ncbi:MAG: DUF4190 domain-containing protein [Phycisphaerales bacterium]|nr:DUF4190 domain-containing protein [Phycisphaerales bacterium]
MTQLDAPQSVQPNQPQKTHVLAILSLICALLLCIPFAAPVFGVIFGVIALILISGSNGRTKGKGMAFAGIAISIVVLLAEAGITYFVINLTKEGAKIVLRDFGSFIQAVESQEFQAAQNYLAPDAASQVTEDHLDELRNRLKDEYGTFNDVSIDFFSRALSQGANQQPISWYTNLNQGPNPGTSMSAFFPIEVEFTGKTAYGTVELEVTDDTTGNAAMHIVTFTLIGDDGPWSFPPEPE